MVNNMWEKMLIALYTLKDTTALGALLLQSSQLAITVHFHSSLTISLQVAKNKYQ
jgi:hypothetical protein